MADRRVDGYGQPHGPTRPWGAVLGEGEYRKGTHVISTRMADGFNPPSASMDPAAPATPADQRAAVLIDAYWKLRDHAAGYRDTKVLRQARERWEASDRRDERLFHKVSIHEHYARGVEAAARDIADMLGVPEHEVERPSQPNPGPAETHPVEG
jgi:hypothetical protein